MNKYYLKPGVCTKYSGGGVSYYRGGGVGNEKWTTTKIKLEESLKALGIKYLYWANEPGIDNTCRVITFQASDAVVKEVKKFLTDLLINNPARLTVQPHWKRKKLNNNLTSAKPRCIL